jgi:hypothetical protein
MIKIFSALEALNLALKVMLNEPNTVHAAEAAWVKPVPLGDVVY